MNRHLATRLADRLPPSRLAQDECVADLMLRFENAERAAEQSKRTRDGKRAEPAPRPELRPLY